MNHESVLTSLAQLERLLRKGLSMANATEEERDAYAVALREAVEAYISALGQTGGMAVPARQTDRYFAQYD